MDGLKYVVTRKMFNKTFLTLILTGIPLIYFKEASGILDFKSIDSSHNENCIIKVMRENFNRNTTVTIFSSTDAMYSEMESYFIKNIFNSINCSVVLYSEMVHSRVYSLAFS